MSATCKVLLLALATSTTACSLLTQSMTGETLRAALDECKSHDLDVLVYRRPDGSVMDVRCIPKPEQVNEETTVRPRLPMKLLRPILRQQGAKE